MVLNTNEEFTVTAFDVKTDNLRFMISKNPDDEPVEITLKYFDADVVYLNDNDEEI